uniref:Uncharacterized protein n=1 Tax=Anguilla anguilla TaxID=7936 RepID=A0A0E9UIF5_ANGAN
MADRLQLQLLIQESVDTHSSSLKHMVLPDASFHIAQDS